MNRRGLLFALFAAPVAAAAGVAQACARSVPGPSGFAAIGEAGPELVNAFHFSVPAADCVLLETRRFQIDEIARAFRVPARMIQPS